MIIGKVKDLPRYKGLNEHLDKAINFIVNHDLLSLPLGKTVINEDKVFINRFDYYPVEIDSCLIEAHEQYLDIHLVLQGCEYLGYADISDLIPVGHYDSNSDFIEYMGDLAIKHPCYAESFVITFPEDAHMPKIKMDNQLVKKAVCKVKIA